MNRKIKTLEHFHKQGLRLLLLALSVLSTSLTFAHDFEVDGIYYNINGTEASVTYKGSSYEVYYEEYTGNVIIPSTVTYNSVTYSITSIGNNAFRYCSSLTNVTIPNSITSVGESAFSLCSSLVSVAIGNSVTSIGQYAFSGCNSLTSVTIPESVTSIGFHAFNCALKTLNYNAVDCADFHSPGYSYSNNQVFNSDITAINIGDEVKRIPDCFASGLNKLANITIPNSVESIGMRAFYGCSSLASVTIGNSVTSIGDYAFVNCSSLASVTIGNSVTSIGGAAFENCTSLYSVHIPNSVTSIGASAFADCSSLTSVTIPNSVTKIGFHAFYCALKTLNYNAVDCAVYSPGSGYSNNQVFNSDITAINIGDEVKRIPDCFASGLNKLANITIPNSVESIGMRAFYGCSSLASVTIGNSVTSIGGYAFENCSSLASVTIGNSVTSIGESVFYGCCSLTNVDIPNSVASIGGAAFAYCSSLSCVAIPDSVTSINSSTFANCSKLSSVDIPNSVTNIGERAFYGCSSLSSVTIPNSVTSIGESAFENCTGLTRVNITDIAAWCRICFYNNYGGLYSFHTSNPLSIAHHLYLNGSEITNLVIPNTVTFISEAAFCGNTGINSVTIPNSVTAINDYVFYYCTGLKNVMLPKTLKSIGKYAFSGCRSLANVTIPNSVTTIGNYAFSACGLTNITIPNSVTNIGNSAFRNCSSLNSATVTNRLTSLGDYAFYDCSALSSFTCMPETPPILDYSSSFGTYNTTSLYVPRSGVENYKTHTNWRRFAKIYEFVGYFTVPDVNVSKGKTVVVPVSMTNEADIIGFQTDIYLPEGFEFVKDGADYVVDPSDRMARDHSIMCNISEDGALRVLCFSPTNKVISGNEGELFYVTIKAPADTVGDFSLCFKNTILTTSDAEELLSPDAYTNINVIPYLPGDANGNGEVSVIDIVTAAQYIIFQSPDPFLFEAADLNNDDQITVTDLALIANLILYPTMNAPKRVPVLELSEEQIHGNDIQLNVGETRTVTITLDHLDEYSAFQMDVKLPNGLTANNFRMSNQSGSHSFITSEEMDGVIRLLCYSPSLAALDNDEKVLLTFDVTATGNIGGNIIIDGIELVTTTCQPVYLDAFAISVNQSSLVNEISSGNSVAQIEYYNLAGQKLAVPAQGVTIVVTTYTDGSRTTQKIVL